MRNGTERAAVVPFRSVPFRVLVTTCTVYAALTMEYSAVRGGKLLLKKGVASVQGKKKKGKRRRSKIEGEASAGTVKHG